MKYSAHVDTFAADHLPPLPAWPGLIFELPELQYPPKLNCAVELVDRQIAAGYGSRPCVIGLQGTWTYNEFAAKVCQIAHVLRDDMHVVPGNRVLLRAPNNPMLAACWFAVMRAGAIAVTTMPLYRSGELAYMLQKAQVTAALCDVRLREDLERAAIEQPRMISVCYFNGDAPDSLEVMMRTKSTQFAAVPTAAEDVALIGFTSGTTGKAKATMHFHRDVAAVCDCFPAYVLKASSEDIFCGSPPLGFTFGLGGILLLPLRIGAASLLLEKATPEFLLQGIVDFKATVCFTAPIAYRAMSRMLDRFELTSLRKCVSAGETLPLPIWQEWYDRTGIKIIDGIGGTEMLHIYIASPQEKIRPGSTGQVVPGYQARIVDDAGNEVPPGTIGRLAVRGPTGCRYLDDSRQSSYVQDGWNFPGDAYHMDYDGYFWYCARIDDMIVAAGYNISGPEVEEALLAHAHVRECAVVSAPDPERGTNMVKAFVVLYTDLAPNDAECKLLQEFVKSQIATYKCPREIAFVKTLPRTETGKLQRFVLRESVTR
ncbi:MAG: AMP-binding protein [Candidatus Eremiobacteraeota bacterium]|nr:AMP-binding protein [Candidatus Eremiobacteraeota bacterium]